MQFNPVIIIAFKCKHNGCSDKKVKESEKTKGENCYCTTKKIWYTLNTDLNHKSYPLYWD